MSEKKFDEVLARLEEIVSELEANKLSMDEALVIFEEGLQLIKTGESKLISFEDKIKDLINASNTE
ncbi:MAG: exodeoxyribonuclease VII small subunit [Erysipelotrichaceae bacterium]